MTLLALPSTREEAWRWSDLSALPELVEREPSGAIPDELPWLGCAGPKLLFVDGQPVWHETPDPVVVSQVNIQPSDHALARLVGKHGWKLKLGTDHAPAGLVQVIHASTGGADHLPAKIALEQDAQASVHETFIGSGWANRLTAITLGKGARLMLSRRLLGSGGFISLTDHAQLGEGASLDVVTLAAGESDSRLDTVITLAGEGAYAETSGALLARGTQRHDANIVLRHAHPCGMSRQYWRSVADDEAICSVAARVEVARAAQKTDAEQSIKGLLLERTATINCKPELEIFADDVKCAHGATVGELDRMALFYLRSRGVPPEEARALLTQAFVADAIERIGEEQVREAFHAEANRWLGGTE
jgi:Fe-S cluster assembly protein SufD